MPSTGSTATGRRSTRLAGARMTTSPTHHASATRTRCPTARGLPPGRVRRRGRGQRAAALPPQPQPRLAVRAVPHRRHEPGDRGRQPVDHGRPGRQPRLRRAGTRPGSRPSATWPRPARACWRCCGSGRSGRSTSRPGRRGTCSRTLALGLGLVGGAIGIVESTVRYVRAIGVDPGLSRAPAGAPARARARSARVLLRLSCSTLRLRRRVTLEAAGRLRRPPTGARAGRRRSDRRPASTPGRWNRASPRRPRAALP